MTDQETKPGWKTADWLSAQVSVLGSVLIDANHWAGEVVSRTAPRDYSDSYRPVFEVIRQKYQAGETIDPVTVKHALGPDSGELLMQIMAYTPTSATCGEYIDLMLEQSRLRQLEGLARRMMEAVNLEEAQALLDKANALACRREKVRVVTMREALQGFYDRQQAEQAVSYLPWGIEPLDRRLYVEAGDFVVLGGYPSDGKTALALSMAFRQGQDKRVGFFSFETRDEKLFDRLIPTLTQVDFGRVKRRDLTEEDWTAVTLKTSGIVGNHLELVPATGMTVSDLKAVAQSRRYEIIYIDYLQLIKPTNPKQSSFEQVTQISMDLHALAQSTGMVVVALSQLSRPEKQGKDTKAPGMHSLRQSGQIEQDADVILFVYREEPGRPNSRRVLKVAKNKEGESGGLILLQFQGSTQTFRQDRNDPERWREKARQDGPEQISMRELPREPVPFEEEVQKT